MHRITFPQRISAKYPGVVSSNGDANSSANVTSQLKEEVQVNWITFPRNLLQYIPKKQRKTLAYSFLRGVIRNGSRMNILHANKILNGLLVG